MPTAVLDLGSMAVLVGTVSLSLDKVAKTEKSFALEMDEMAKAVAARISKFDTPITYTDQKGNVKVEHIYLSCHCHFLLRVASSEACKHYPWWLRGLYWFHRNWHAPCFEFMRYEKHKFWLKLFTFLSIINFFLLVANDAFDWKVKGVAMVLPDAALFVIFSVTILLAFAAAALAHRLTSKVAPLCGIYFGELDEEKQHLDQTAENIMRGKVRAFTQSGPPSGPTGPTGTKP